MNVHASPADTDPAGLPRAEGEGLTWLQELHRELGRIANVALPEPTLAGIMKDMSDWTYGTEPAHSGRSTRFLHRTIADRSVLVDLPDEDQERRVVRDGEGIRIRTREITGADLRCAVGIELQLELLEEAEMADSYVLEVMPKREKKEQPEPNPEALRFQATTGTFLEKGDLFTDTEEVVLSHMTRCDSFDKLAAAVGTSGSTISRVVKPARERLGLESNIDLMLLAIARGIADIDHVPGGMTAYVSPKDRELLREFYSTDPEVRESRRAKPLFDASRWSRMYDKLDGLCHDGQGNPIRANRHWMVLYALKDDVIELPAVEQGQPVVVAKS